MYTMRRGVFVAVLLLSALTAAAQTTAPVITSISPDTAVAGTPGFEMTIDGANFVSGNSVVRVNGSNRITTFVSTTRLRATIQTGDLTTAGTKTITVFAGGRTSNGVTLTIVPNEPRIETLTPDTVSVGTTNLTVRISGANFASTARARVNAVERATTFVDDTTLDFQLLPADVASQRTLTITVLNPNTRISNSVTMQVRTGALTPEITSIDPATVVRGGPAFTLRITGRNFDRSALVRFDSITRSPTFISDTALDVQVLSSQIATARTIAVSVVNPNNLVSNAVNLTVDTEATPTITTITPESLVVNSGTLTITVDGTNFENGAQVRVGGAARNTAFVSATRLTAALLTTDVSSVRELAITVRNPGTDGRESTPKPLFVVAQNGPTISSIAPTSITAGTRGARIVVNGTNYQNGDVVLIDGAPRDTQFISTTALAATLLDSDTAARRDLLVTVRKILNGAVSAPFTLRVVDAATPFIESFNPPNATAGSGAFTLRVFGRNFAPDSTVTLGTRAATTRYVSSTELSVDVIASDITTVGTLPVVVTNGDGAQSAAVNLPVLLIVPAISSIDPTSVPAGDPGFTLSVSGTNFTSSSTIDFDGVAQTGTRFNASTNTLTLIVPASQLTVPRAISVTVTENGVASAPRLLVVASPSITNVNPSVIVAGGADAVLTVTGANFVPGSRGSFKGGERPTTFVSSSQLTVTVPFTALLETGTFALTVSNTADAVSNPFDVTISTPGLPTIFSITPTQVTAGTSTQLVVVNGANFLAGARIAINGVTRETQFVSASELALFLTAADMAVPGTLAFTVVAAGGEVSNGVTLTVLPRPTTGGRRRAVDVP
jgi:IPT/TIG domain